MRAVLGGFAGSEGKKQFHRIGRKGRIWQPWGVLEALAEQARIIARIIAIPRIIARVIAYDLARRCESAIIARIIARLLSFPIKIPHRRAPDSQARLEQSQFIRVAAIYARSAY